MQQKSELPEGWAYSIFSDFIVHALGGDWGKEPSTPVPEEMIEVNVIRGTEFKKWDTEKGSSAVKRIIKKSSLAKRSLQKNDIVIEISGGGPDQPVGRTLIIDEKTIEYSKYPLVCSNFCRQLRLSTHLNANYVNLALKFQYSNGLFNKYQTQTTNIRNLQFQDFVSEIKVPVPPLSEQHRIVSAIEALFARLDATNKKLDRVPETLKAFRQAVIKLALQGKLVDQDPADEPALKLIETIRTDLTDDKIERKKLVSIDSEENLFELPYSWKWIRLGEVLTFGPKNGYSPKPVNHVTNVRALTLTATTSGKFRDDCFKYIDEEIDAKSYLWLKENDILIQRGNTLEYVGVAAIYKGDSNAFIYPDLMMKIRVHPKINVEFLHMVINSKFSRKYFEKKATGTSGSMPKINQTTIVNLPIPLPPLPEQQEIVRRVDALFAFADSIEANVAVAREKTEKLMQSILAKAFSGKLVETEAEIARREGREYEKAEVLLERIKAERGKLERKR